MLALSYNIYVLVKITGNGTVAWIGVMLECIGVNSTIAIATDNNKCQRHVYEWSDAWLEFIRMQALIS